MGKPVRVLSVGHPIPVIIIIRVIDVIPESVPIRIFLKVDVLVINPVLFNLFTLSHILILVFLIISHLIYLIKPFKPDLILNLPGRLLMPPCPKDKAEEGEGEEASTPETQKAPVTKTPGP